MGWKSQPTRLVSFDGVRVPVTHRLGAEGEGFNLAMKGLDGGRLNIASCSLGAAQHALTLARDYMAERKQFGRDSTSSEPCSSNSPAWPPNSGPHARCARS